MPSTSFELRLYRSERIVSLHPLGSAPMLLGRGPQNHLVLLDPAVSTTHASVRMVAGRPVIEDLGSRNGTFVNDQRVDGAQPLDPQDRIVIGGTRLDVVAVDSPDDAPLVALVLEDVGACTRHPIRSDRFRIGPASDCDLVIPDTEETSSILLTEGHLLLGRDDDTHPIELGEPFEACGRSFVVLHPPDALPETRELGRTTYPYVLRVGLGHEGAHATVVDQDRSTVHTVNATNRRTLLFLLGKQWVEDIERGIDPAFAGWVDERDLQVGIWGREGVERTINVVLCRVRKELRQAGFDPWFIEKQARRVRARVLDAQLDQR